MLFSESLIKVLLATEKFADGTTGLIKNTYSKNASVFDVWSAQLGIRYIFGK